MTAVSFNIQIAAALGDKVCNQYLVHVAKGVLVTVIEVDLWFAVTDGRTASLQDTGGHFEVCFLPARTVTT